MASSEEHTPLLDPPSHFNRANTEKINKRKYRGIQLLAVCYSLLLCWQLAGSCLFVMRCVTCFRNETLTYQCDNNVPFRYSGELELTWLVTQCLHGVILIVALHKVPAFPGYKAIFRQLKLLPSFWTLILLYLAALSRFAILSVSSKSLVHLMIVSCFALSYVIRVLTVSFLNYTQLNSLNRQYPTYVFVLAKLTLFVIFIECFNNFILSILSIALRVEDIHHTVHIEMERTSALHTIYNILREFTTTTFRLKIMNFFWQKMFLDRRNHLSHYDYLQ